MRKLSLLLMILAILLATCGGGGAANAPTESANASLPPAEGADEGVASDEPAATDVPVEPMPGVVYEGACASPYFPVQEGLTYSYVYKTPDQPNVEMLIWFTEVTADGFVMHQTLNERIELEARWTCGDEGLVATAYTNVRFAAAGYDLTTIGTSGVDWPLEADLQLDATWSSQFDVQATFANEFGSGDATMIITETSQALGFIDVTVPAGSYDDALQVETTTNFEITTLEAGEATGTVTVSTTTSSWYVEGLGLVRQEMLSQGVTSTLELLEILQ